MQLCFQKHNFMLLEHSKMWSS